MNWKERHTQPFMLGACILSAAILLCLLLFFGCSAPPKAASQPVQTPSAEQTTPNPPQTQPPKPAPASSPVQTPATEGEPIMTVEKTVHDFGDVGPLSRNVCEFRFKNTGTGTLKINEKIDSTCGCTVPALSKTEYAPGEEGAIQVTYSASDSAGPAVRMITVHSNDRSHGGKISLTIKAKIVERVAYEPRQLDLRLKGPDAGCPPITLRSLDNRAFSITQSTSTGNAITVQVDPSVQATTFTLHPTLDADKLQRYSMGTLVLTLTHPECRQVRIEYHALPEFQFSPPSITVFGAEPNRPVPKETWLSNNYGEDFEIASSESKQNLIELVGKEKVVSEDKKSIRYHLRLSVKPPAPSGTQRAFADILTIRLTNGNALQLPCRIFYAAPRVPSTDTKSRQP